MTTTEEMFREEALRTAEADRDAFLGSTLSVAEAASITQRSAPMIRHYIRSGVLKAMRDPQWPHGYRIIPTSLLKLVKAPRLKAGGGRKKRRVA
jgi:hypothetical protein